MLKIAEAQVEELRSLMKRAEKAHVRMKATALWNLAQGKSRQEVAAFLGVSKASLSSWTQRFRKEGERGLAIRPGRGRKPRAVAAEVEAYLRQSPRAWGVDQTRWTLRALRQVVPSLHGFTVVGVWKVLNRAGFRYKQGQPRLHSPDPEYGEKRGPWSKPSMKLWQSQKG